MDGAPSPNGTYVEARGLSRWVHSRVVPFPFFDVVAAAIENVLEVQQGIPRRCLNLEGHRPSQQATA